MKRSSKILVFITTMALTFGSLMAFVGHKRFQNHHQFGHHHACGNKEYLDQKKGANTQETAPKDTSQ